MEYPMSYYEQIPYGTPRNVKWNPMEYLIGILGIPYEILWNIIWNPMEDAVEYLVECPMEYPMESSMISYVISCLMAAFKKMYMGLWFRV
jgi:hypothetical protein